MNKYQYLLLKKQNGELPILFDLGLPIHLISYMEICAFHLAHPELSQWKVSLEFGVSKFYVWKAYQLLNN